MNKTENQIRLSSSISKLKRLRTFDTLGNKIPGTGAVPVKFLRMSEFFIICNFWVFHVQWVTLLSSIGTYYRISQRDGAVIHNFLAFQPSKHI